MYVCLNEKIFFFHISRRKREQGLFFFGGCFFVFTDFRDKKKLTLNVRDAIIAYVIVDKSFLVSVLLFFDREF